MARSLSLDNSAIQDYDESLTFHPPRRRREKQAQGRKVGRLGWKVDGPEGGVVCYRGGLLASNMPQEFPPPPPPHSPLSSYLPTPAVLPIFLPSLHFRPPGPASMKILLIDAASGMTLADFIDRSEQQRQTLPAFGYALSLGSF